MWTAIIKLVQSGLSVGANAQQKNAQRTAYLFNDEQYKTNYIPLLIFIVLIVVLIVVLVKS